MKEYININGVDLVSGVNVLNIKYPAGYTTYMRSGTPADTVIIILEGKISCTGRERASMSFCPGMSPRSRNIPSALHRMSRTRTFCQYT